MDRFFAAIADRLENLPLVTGELQPHAVGCYSVHRPVKLGVRRAEHRLEQARIGQRLDPAPEADTARRLEQAWRRVCFHHFHDTLGGTCLPSAFRQVEAQLGEALATGDELLHHGFRRWLAALPADRRQRIALYNASDQPFAGYVSFDPWLERRRWQAGWRLLDEHDEPVAYQTMAPEAVVSAGLITRLLFHQRLEPGATRVLRIDMASDEEASPMGRAEVCGDRLSNDRRVAVDLGLPGSMRLDGRAHALPHLALIEDDTDTWSHGIDRYAEGPVISPQWHRPAVLDTGPLMASLLQQGKVGVSPLLSEFRVYGGEPWVEWRLRVTWVQRHQVLKLVWSPSARIASRVDGIPGGYLKRDLDGVERPLRDWTLLELVDGQRLGIVCPEIFGVDVTPLRVRLTLLRSPLLAHHEGGVPEFGRGVPADQGLHELHLRFVSDDGLEPAALDQHAWGLHRPPVIADLTRGMGRWDAAGREDDAAR